MKTTNKLLASKANQPSGLTKSIAPVKTVIKSAGKYKLGGYDIPDTLLWTSSNALAANDKWLVNVFDQISYHRSSLQ